MRHSKTRTATNSQLDDEAIISFSRLLLLAGGGTTFRQMGITLFALLSNRDQMEDVRADRSLMRLAIEESVRWNCTDPLFHRLALKDSVLEGFEIPEGSYIDVCLGPATVIQAVGKIPISTICTAHISAMSASLAGRIPA